MNLIYFAGKNIFVRLINGGVYNGVVLEVVFMGSGENNNDIYMVTIKDKFDKIVSFSSSEIKFIEEKE
jgi:hypothetical protein